MTSATVHLVISALGPDRPGLVDALSEFILAAGGNIEESRMAVLGGEFGVLLLTSGSEAAAAKIEGELGDMARRAGLVALVKRTSAPGARPRSEALPYTLTASSLDQPGIVNRVSRLLAHLGVNIESAECTARPGPWSGAPLFHLEMAVTVPRREEVKALRAALAQLGGDEGIDIELRPVT